VNTTLNVFLSPEEEIMILQKISCQPHFLGLYHDYGSSFFFFLLIYNQHEINWKNLDTDTSYSVDLEAFALVADHEKVRKTDIIYYNNFGCLLWCFMELVPNQQYCSPVCKQLKAACTEELGEWTRMSIKSFHLQLFLQTRMYYVR